MCLGIGECTVNKSDILFLLVLYGIFELFCSYVILKDTPEKYNRYFVSKFIFSLANLCAGGLLTKLFLSDDTTN